MAYAEVGSGTQRATKVANAINSTTLAFPASPGSGRLLIVGGVNWHSGTVSPINTVTDTLGTSYSILKANSGLNNIFIAYGVTSSSGANTVTVTPTTQDAGNYISFSIDEFSGNHATPLDVDGGLSEDTGTAITEGLTTLTANDLIIGVCGFTDFSNYTLTPGGSYTQIGEEEDGSANSPHNAVFRIVTTAQAYTVDWTVGTSNFWFAYSAAFKEATSGVVIPVFMNQYRQRWK